MKGKSSFSCACQASGHFHCNLTFLESETKIKPWKGIARRRDYKKGLTDRILSTLPYLPFHLFHTFMLPHEKKFGISLFAPGNIFSQDEGILFSHVTVLKLVYIYI